MQDHQAAGTVAAETIADPGWARRGLFWISSVHCWTFLALSTLVWYTVALIASAFVGGRQALRWGLDWWARTNLAGGFFRWRVEGRERLAGPQILVANHQHFFDIMLLAAVVPQPLAFVARVRPHGSGSWRRRPV